jgi:acyl-homoserine lactone acylase PvdQ
VRGLKAPATVVRTEMNVPHIYASDREDLSRVYGFVMARDRAQETNSYSIIFNIATHCWESHIATV